MASDTGSTQGPALADLLARLADEGVRARGAGDLSTVVRGVTLDSRRVSPGDVYAAVPGSHGHGATYWPQARAAGHGQDGGLGTGSRRGWGCSEGLRGGTAANTMSTAWRA